MLPRNSPTQDGASFYTAGIREITALQAFPSPLDTTTHPRYHKYSITTVRTCIKLGGWGRFPRGELFT